MCIQNVYWSSIQYKPISLHSTRGLTNVETIAAMSKLKVHNMWQADNTLATTQSQADARYR